MLKLLYLATWDFSDGPSAGITNKIKGQIKAFNAYGFSVDYTYIANNAAYFYKDEQDVCLGKVGRFRKLAANYYLFKRLRSEEYACVYNRYGLMDTFYYKLLKMLKNKGSKIVAEIPTYPYDRTHPPGVAGWLLFALDKVYRNRIKKYVDMIATYSDDAEIFGIKTIHIHNGIDFERVLLRQPQNITDEIHLIGVAGLSKWHGYDRLLEGMGQYYQTGGKRKIFFHIVGDGPAKGEYEGIVEKYQLQDYCIFEGIKIGNELDEIYDKCDIGIESLAFFRIGVFLSSSLKSREYGAKGIPFIMGSKSDVFDDQDFVLKVPEDESAINIQDIISFYEHMYKNCDPREVAKTIRSQAEKCCDIQVTMKPIIEYLTDGTDLANDL